MHQSQAWGPWVTTLVFLFMGCGSDSAATGPAPAGSVANELAAAPSAATVGEPVNAAIDEPIGEPIDEAVADAVNGAIQGSADPLATDWTSTAGTVAPFEVTGKGTAALALELPRGQTETCSGELSFEWKRTDTLEFQLWMQTPTESFGEVQVVLRPSAPGATEIKLPAVAIHDKQAGVFHTIVSSVESEGLVVGEDAPVQVCIVINAEAGRYVVDDVQFTYPPPIDDSIGDVAPNVTPNVTNISMSSGLTSFSTGYAGAPTLTTSEPDPVPDMARLLGPNSKGADWEISGTKAAATKAAATKARAPKAGATGTPSIASFELDDPDFCTTETLLPTAPFVSSVSPAPNGTTIPYPLCTAAQYAHLINTSDLWSSNFVLMGDIDLGTLEAPPSTAGVTLSGVFEGNGRTLSNYSIESTEAAGVLGKLGSNGIIRNLVLRDFNVSGVNRVAALVHESRGLIEHVTGINLTASGSTSIGVNLGIAGVVGVNNGTLSDVTASVNITGVSDAYSIGGLVGRQGRIGQQLEGFMADCSVSGSVTRLVGELSMERVSTGGALGYLEDGSVVNTHASVSVVSAASVVGGLAGYTRDHIVGSSAVGAVSSDGGMVGGLVGVSNSVIQSSFSTSSVSAGTHVGGLVGYTEPNASIIDSYATGPVQGTGERVGGLCGTNRGVISRSFATGGVQGVDYVGGLAGLVRGSVEQSWSSSDISATGEHAGGLVGLLDGQIDASHFRGDVTGVRYVGGLVGTVEVGAAVEDSSATGSTVAGDQTIGGVVGWLKGTAERCWATASVSANTGAGGLVGGLHGAVIDSYATGAVSAVVNKAGGLVATLAATGSIVRAYAAGSVSGASPAGGLVAETLGGTLEDCHFNATENPGLNAVGSHPSATGVAANSAGALRQEATFADWDFEEVWGIIEDYSFPFLQPVPSCASDGCGLGCPCPADICTSEADCTFGQVCGEANGGYFDEDPDADVCWDPLCETEQRQQLCAAEGAPCGECPSEETGCLSNADCADGAACGQDNGGHFGQSKTTNVCWPEGCSEDVFETGCGPENAPCGLCWAIPNLCSDDGDCAAGEVCGEGNGRNFGLSASDRVCWPTRCEGTPDASDIGSLDAPCGVGVCQPSCEGKQCGDVDGCGGYCPVCTSLDFIDGGCVDDGQCLPTLKCAANGMCATPSCQDVAFFEANCGPTEPCGPCVECENGCGSNECGVDPRCEGECGGGSCSAGLSCVAGQCVGSPVWQEPDPVSTVGRLEGTFSVTPNGSATYSIPISVPPGRAGLQPELSVVYTSDKEDGLLGIGWKLTGLPFIARCPASAAQSNDWGQPVRLDGSDRFCLGEEMLVAEGGLSEYGEDGTFYRTERETFARFESIGSEEVNGIYRGPDRFKVRTKDGLDYFYGVTDDASVFAYPRSNRVKRAWALNEIRDRSGNTIKVRYKDTYDPVDGGSETLELLPWSIHYSPGDREVRFTYEPRSEQRVQYTTGARIYHTQRLASIQTVVGDRVTRSYEFQYEEPNPGNPLVRPLLLTEMRECVIEDELKRCKTSTQFAYQNAQGLTSTELDVPAGYMWAVMDVDGDGLDDIVNSTQVGFATGDRGAPFNVDSHPPLDWPPADIDELLIGVLHRDLQSRVLDYDGDGADEFVVGHYQTHSGEREPLSIYGWDGENFGEVHRTEDQGYYISAIKTADLNGDGLKDIYVCGSEANEPDRMKLWLSERTGGAVSYSAFSRGEGFDPGDCMPETNLFLDVDGDGVANVVRHDVPSGDWFYLADLPNFNGRWIPLRVTQRLEPPQNFLFGNSSLTLVEPNAGDLSVYEPFALRVGNANGDRLVDIFEWSLEGPITWTAFGGGFKYHLDRADGYNWDPWVWAAADVADYDGDGRDDLIVDGQLHQATDKGFVETSIMGVELGSMVGDYDGDGVQDYLWQERFPLSGDPNLQRVHFGSTKTSFLLWVVTDGLGLEHEIRYDRFDPDGQATYSTNAAGCVGTDTYCIKKPPPLVSAVQVWESRMGAGYEERVQQEFHYKDLRRGVDGRGSYGMGERVVTTYGPGRVFQEEIREVYHNDSFELAGMLKARETRTDMLEPTRIATSHSRTTTEDTEWEVRLSDAGRSFPFPAETRTVVEEEDDTGALHELYHVTVTRDADAYGNLTSVQTVAGDPRIVNNPSVIRRTGLTVTYEHEVNPSRIDDWLIALPSQHSETASRSEFLSPEREMDFTYDEHGLLETATRLGSGSEYQRTTLVRDQYGNVEVAITRDAEDNEREERITYDSRGLFPESVTNAEGETTSVRVNEALGRPDEIKDANGLSDRFYYDGFGRLTRVEGWKGDVSYVYSDPAFGPGALDPASDGELGKQRVTITTSHGALTYTDTDAFGRTVRRMTRGLFDTEVIQSFVYDWNGTLMRESRPHENGDFSQGVIEYEYDNWHRLIATHFPDATSIERYYATPPTYVGSGPGLPASGELFQLARGLFAEFVTKRENTNSSEFPIEGAVATDHLGVVLTASDAGATLTDYYYSEFDLLDRIDHVRGDGRPIDTWVTYDLWGRAESIEDPDVGHTLYTYTGFDEVDTAMDAEGLVTDFDYDNVGRLIERRDTQDDETLVTTWTYGDSASSNNIGRVAQANSPDGIVTQYFFKPDGDTTFGLPDSVITNVPRTAGSNDVETFAVQYDYDSQKRVQGIVYPSVGVEAFSVVLGRDGRGNISTVTDGTDPTMVYWEATADYQGVAVSQECLGNGVCTNTTFEDVTGRIQSIESQMGPQAYSPGDLIQDLKYLYYPSGLLEQQTDPSLPADSQRIYGYDALDRLRSEAIGIGASVNWYEYDPLGNLTLKDDQTLAYDRPDSVLPHAVRRMGDNEYEYDAKGNQVLRTGPDVVGGRQKIRYTPFNLPKQIDTGPEESPDVTTFDYDAAHTRTAKRSASATTLFIGGLYERVEPTGPSSERIHKYHVYAGGRRVAQVQRAEDIEFESLGPPEYQFLSRDRLGSVHTVMDVDGDVVDLQRTYRPFGQPDDDLISSNDIRAGFTGHEHDSELGLIDMRGRVYDPELGRFLTPDPLANPLNLQSLNRYSYVLNSPMNLVDPTGFQAGPTGTDQTRAAPEQMSVQTMYGGGSASVPQYDNAADVPWLGETPTTPQDLGHADPSESGPGPSQTAPRPSPGGSDRAGAAEGAAPQPANAAGPPAPDQSTAPISAPGGGPSGGSPIGGGGGGPRQGGSRPAPGGSEPGRALSGGSSGGGAGNLGILADATTQIRDTSEFWETSLQIAMALTPSPGSGPGLIGLGAQATLWARGLLAAAVRARAVGVGGAAHPLRAINPSGCMTNCANTSIALDATLAGHQASALPGPLTTTTELAGFYGARGFSSAPNIAAIQTRLLGLGPGARGIVFGYRGAGQPGHFFNAVNQGGTVHFLDGQIGGLASTDGFIGFQFLLTSAL